jgi:hypothetical protein
MESLKNEILEIAENAKIIGLFIGLPFGFVCLAANAIDGLILGVL